MGERRPVPRWLRGPSLGAAPRLLGARIVSELGGERVVVSLTEVEAYGGVGIDPGSHSFRGMTPRNATMFGPAGHLYVYFTYGMHWCMNIVTETEGVSNAVLLRAGRVIEGVDVARGRRLSSNTDRDLARGPARLTTALGVTGTQDGLDAFDPTSPVRLELTGRREPFETSPRTGVGGDGAALPWRFFIPGDPTVSPYKAAAPRTR